jgi:hypothetical protein
MIAQNDCVTKGIIEALSNAAGMHVQLVIPAILQISTARLKSQAD